MIRAVGPKGIPHHQQSQVSGPWRPKLQPRVFVCLGRMHAEVSLVVSKCPVTKIDFVWSTVQVLASWQSVLWVCVLLRRKHL